MPKYPLAMTSDGKKAKGKMKKMKPEAFLEAARKLTASEGDRDIINKFKDDIKSGEPMGPLKLHKDGKEDGRHRATAAKELGVGEVPVIDERTQKALGGALTSDDPNKFFSDVMKFSFAVLPLLRPGYLKEVPKQGFAHGGHVLEDDYSTHYLPEVGRQVMADGGVPGQRFAAMDPSMLVGTSPQPYRGGAAYTDPGGLKVAAPFVSGLAGGYPVFNLPAPSAPEKEEEAPASPAPSGPDPMVLLALMKAAKMFADGGAVESPRSIADLLREIENEETIRKTLQAIQGTSEPSEGSTTTRGGSSPTTPQETDMEALLGRVMGTTPAGELRTPGIIESVPFDSPKQKMDPGEYISRGSTAARAHPFVFEKTPYHFGEDFARGGVTDALNAVRKLAGTPA